MKSFLKFSGCLIALAVMVCGLWQSNVQAAETISAAKRLPAETCIYISIPNVPDATARLRQTAAGQMLAGPAFGPARDQLLELLADPLAQFQERFGIRLEALASQLSGEVCVAVITSIEQPKPQVISMFDMTGHRDVLDQLIARAESGGESDSSITKSTEEIDGTEITTWTLKETTDSPYDSICYCVKDEHFAIATDVSALEAVLERWDGEDSGTLADDEVYQTILKRCRSGKGVTPAVITYLQPIPLVGGVLALSPATAQNGPAFMAALPLLGLHRFKAVGGTIELATEEYDSIWRALYYVQQPPSGLLNVFRFRSTITGPPEWVSADSSSYFGFDWDVAAAYQALESTYDLLQGRPGALEAMLQGLTRQVQGPQVEIRDIVNNTLTGEIQAFVNDSVQSTGIAIGVKSDERGRELVQAFLSLYPAATSDVVQGVDAHVLDEESIRGMIAVKDGFIYFATTREILEDQLGGKTEQPLSQSTDYQAVAEHFPDQASLLRYHDATAAATQNYTMLREGRFDALMEGAYDFSVLPTVEELMPYLAPTGTFIIPDEHGAFYCVFQLRRESKSE